MSSLNDPFTTDSGYDPMFFDAPMPLMSFTASPSKQVLEQPKTGFGYKLPSVSHLNSGADPDFLLDSAEMNKDENGGYGGKESLHDKALSAAMATKLAHRNRVETVVDLNSLDKEPNCPSCVQAPHATLVYNFSEVSKEKGGGKKPPMHGGGGAGVRDVNNSEMKLKQQQVAETSLKFDSFFESGNLNTAQRVVGRDGEKLDGLQNVDHEYDLLLRFDTHTVGNIQWFYFSATSPADMAGNGKLRCRLNITNMMKKSSLYQFGMKPLVYCVENKRWVRGGEEIAYFRNKDTYQPKKKKKKVSWVGLS